MESLEQFLVANHPEKPKRHVNRAALLGAIVFGLIILGVAAWFGYGYYQKQQFIRQVPADVRSQTTFPVYLPKSSAVGVKTESISYSNGVFQYVATVNGKQVVVSQQAKTSDFELTKFATSQMLSGAQQSTIPIGSLLSATLRDRPLNIVDTGETIITITGTQTGSADTLRPLTNSLQKL